MSFNPNTISSEMMLIHSDQSNQEFTTWLNTYVRKSGLHVYTYTYLLRDAWNGARNHYETKHCECPNLAGDCDGIHNEYVRSMT